MATDSAILTAAREVAALRAVMIQTDQAKVEAENMLRIRSERCNESRRLLAEAERRLLDLSRQKPAEPGPKATIPDDYAPAATMTVTDNPPPDLPATLCGFPVIKHKGKPKDQPQPAEPGPESLKIEVVVPTQSGGYEKVMMTSEQIKKANEAVKKQSRTVAGG